jgi:hypothetical protein
MPKAVFRQLFVKKKKAGISNRIGLGFLVFFLFNCNLYAQVPSDVPINRSIASEPSNWVLGFDLTGTAYYGDLNYSSENIFQSNFLTFSPGFNLNFHSGKARRLSPEVNIGFGNMIGQNPELGAVSFDPGDNSPPLLIQPNTYAQTFFVYGDLGLRLNLLKRPGLLQPFLGAGLGILTFFPENERGLSLVRRRSTRAPSEATFEALTYSLPLSLGLDLNLSPRFGLHIAYTYRLPGTDYLDNIDRLGQQPGNDELHILRLGAHLRFIEQVPARIPQRPLPYPTSSDSLPLAAEQTDDGSLFDEALGPIARVDSPVLPLTPQPDCDSLILGYEERQVKLEARQASWQEQAYRLQAKLERQQKRSDSLEQEVARRDRIAIENETLREQVKALKEGQGATADQRLNFLAMKAENGFLIEEVERLRTATQQERLQQKEPQIEAEALQAENDWYVQEIARMRRQVARKQAQVWMDTIQVEDSLLAISQSEGLLVDISGYRVVTLTRRPNPMQKVLDWMEAHGHEGYWEEGTRIYAYTTLKQVGYTTYQLQFTTSELESGLHQLIVRFIPEVGRLPISTYLRESRKARDVVEEMIR